MPPVTITITFDGPGKPLAVNAPLDNKMLCYAMLELARDLIKDYEPSKIIKPTLHVVPTAGN